MQIKCTPAIVNPVELIGPADQQREAARKYCLIAYSKGARTVTLTTPEGSVSGRPIALLESLSGRNQEAYNV